MVLLGIEGWMGEGGEIVAISLVKLLRWLNGEKGVVNRTSF